MATIKEIKEELAAIDSLSADRLIELAADSRQGVQQAVNMRRKQILSAEKEDARLEKMLSYEKVLYAKGLTAIAGIDEVGRGPLAGPVVAAAVILPVGCKITHLNDSKQIPKSRHEEIAAAVREKAVAIGIGQVEAATIDSVNIYQATKLAMLSAVAQLEVEPEHLLIDAMSLDLPIEQTSIIKGDANSLSIAAASIIAKVTRDALMQDYDNLYPEYGFAHNAGYGTAEHLSALTKHGITPIHRKSFEPVKSLINK